MKYSLNEFAQQIRKISNNDYDDLNDEELVNLWLKKYPNDRAKIDFSKSGKVKLQTNTTTTSSKNFDNNSPNSQNKGGSNSLVVGLILIVAVIIGGFYFYNQSHSGSLENTGSNTSDVINNDDTEPDPQDAAGILNKGYEGNNQIDNSSNSNNSNQNSYQQRQKQWVNCRYCNGKGIKICIHCTGRGTEKCSRCNGRTYLYKTSGGGTETCYECGGRGEKSCSHCNGKGNDGTCSSCGGRGQVQE